MELEIEEGEEEEGEEAEEESEEEEADEFADESEEEILREQHLKENGNDSTLKKMNAKKKNSGESARGLWMAS